MAMKLILSKNYPLLRVSSLLVYAKQQPLNLKKLVWINSHRWLGHCASPSLYQNTFHLLQDQQIKPKYSFETVDYLISKGINVAAIEKSYHSLLNFDVNHLQSNYQYLVTLGLNSTDLISVIESAPMFIMLDLDKLKSIIKFWQKFGLREQNVIATIVKAPQIFLYSIRTEIQPKTNLLLSFVTQKQIIHLIQLQPALFTFKLTDAEIRIDWLAQLGFEKDDIGSIIRRLPSFLLKNFDAIQNSVDWLKSHNYDMEQIKKMLIEYPGIFRRDVSVMTDIKNFFLQIGYTIQEFKSVIYIFPSLLCGSVSSLEARYQFASDILKCSIDEIKKTPALFTCKFDQIKIRYAFLQSVNRSDNVVLKQLILANDKRFAKEEAKSNIGEFYKFLRATLK